MRRPLLTLVSILALLGVTACEGARPAELPTPNPGASEHLIGPSDATPRYLDGVGAVRVSCQFSHANYSDPILAPGKPFGSHLHQFFGNTTTNYRTTSETLQAGNSTCTGGTANRTAYWAPALLDMNGNASWRDCVPRDTTCEMVVPGGDPVEARACTDRNYWTDRWCVDRDNAAQFYYKTGYQGVASDTVQNWPPGLRMIVGDAKATGPQPTDHVWWGCKDGSHGDVNSLRTASIPETGCQPGQLLVQAAEFPQCWDGVNLDSPDHKSHMSYGAGWPDKGCPASHPVPLPQVTQWIHYRIPQGADINDWRLSSDMYNDSSPGGWSNHADWWNGWDLDVFQRIVDNCYADGLDCRMNLLGDGTALG